MSFDSYTENSRRGPKVRGSYEDNRYGENPDSRRRIFDGMNGHGACDNSGEAAYGRRDRFREESRDYGGDHYQRGDDESDEEGEVKEAGATRDLREEIEAKRVRRQGSKINLSGTREREDIPMKRTIAVVGYSDAGRRDQALDEAQDMNGSLHSRRSEGRRPALDFRRNVDDSELGLMRRRGQSPDSFRPREVGVVGLRRISPNRRPSPGLRRSLGRSSSPNRRNPVGFHNEQHPDSRFFAEARCLSREPREHDFREHQSPGRFGAVAGPGFLRDAAPLPVSRTTTIHVRNLPVAFSVERLKNDLFQDCIRFGRVVDICIDFRGNERHAFVTFAEPAMAEDARRHMNRTPFHGSSLDVELDNGFPPGEATFWRKSDERDAGLHHMHHFQEEMDDPSSNCRIIVDDLDERLQDSEILNKFKSYGAVETFDIQRERGRLSAIIRFRSLSSAVRARREMNGQPFGDRRCRVDYRFADPTCELWVGGVHISVTEADVNREFSRFGRLCKVQINRANKCAFVSFDRVEDAVQAAANMRGRVLGSAAWKLKVDFADRSMGRSHSPGQFARFPKAAQMRVGSAEAVPAQPPPAHQAAAAPPQVTVQQTPAQQVTGPAQQATVQQVPAQQSVGQQIPADQIQNDVSDSGKEMEINVRAQSQTEQNSDSVPSSDSPANKKAVAGDGDAASNAANVTAGMKRREPEVARAEGMHPEKKALSIVVESSSSSSEASSKTNGHCSFDCLTARPGAGGDADASPRLEEHAEPQRDAAEEGATSDPLERFPELWRGLAVVKGSAAGVILRSVKCEDRLAKDMLVGERVTMTQRMRLGEEQMKEFGNRLQSTGEASRGVLLAVPASAEDGPLLRQLFVSYLLERNAAGVARLDTGMLYLFPPGSELASEYQKSAAIDLSHHPDYLLVILLQDL